MKIQFEDGLSFQQEAINAVCDLFAGHERGSSVFTLRAPSRGGGSTLRDVDSDIGTGNAIGIDDSTLLANLRAVQIRNGLAPRAC
ncbi:hypothetical protein [Microbacterium laevaniformans]|uniref:hypothetical protein n=1 Tax=Microbacterium laevaniformans TaxID=36807 RepID=UPI00077A6437|nr:hypothetical protein [Microbacterium laevaniformans]